jgi:membrane protease YdiL (CAAX protease family)
MSETLFPLPPAPEKSRWSDLLLYLVGGFGLYLLATLVLGLLITDFTNIWAIFSIYLLNGLCLGGSLYFWGVRRGKTSWSALGVYPPVWNWRWFWLAIGLTALLIPIRGVLALIVEWLLGGGSQGLQTRMDLFTAGGGFSWLKFALSLLGIGIIAPISEEFYFRGLLQGWLKGRFSFWPRILLSAALFGLAHFDTLSVAVSAVVMGLVNAVALEKSKSLWLPVFLHMLTNSFALIVLYLSMLLLPALGIQ